MVVDPDGRSTLFAHLNQGKASLALGGDRPSRDRLSTLAECADVMIVDSGDKGAQTHTGGEGPRTLCKFVLFGPGPMEDWKGSELVYQALSGTMYENGRLGRAAALRHGRLRLLCGRRARLHPVAGDACSATSARASWTWRSPKSPPRCRSIASRNSVITARSRDATSAPFRARSCAAQTAGCRSSSTTIDGDTPAAGSASTIWRTTRASPAKPRGSATGARSRPSSTGASPRAADEIVAAGQRERAVVARAMSPLELLAEPQLVARGYWRKRIKPGELLRLGAMFRMSDTPQQDHGFAPEIGADGEAVVVGWKRAPVRRAGASQRPLDGVRVLDLTTAWSGRCAPASSPPLARMW